LCCQLRNVLFTLLQEEKIKFARVAICGNHLIIIYLPHFEVLGDKYKNNDPSSEEEVWIPIKPKVV
jgi:hypothetical protein